VSRRSRPARDGELILGRNAVLEVLRAGRRKVRRVLIADGVRETETVGRIISLAAGRGVPIGRVGDDVLQGEDGKSHGMGAEAEPYPYVALADITLAAAAKGEAPLILLLDELQDPQNLGTLLRTAEAAGAHGVVLPYRRAVGITPAVVRASAGACEHMLIAAENLAEAIQRLRDEGVLVVGLEPGEARALEEVELAGPLGLVIGSEGAGLRRLVRDRCDILAGLALRGRIGSLNAAVAGSIALYLAWVRRRETTAGIDAPRDS
jgi:23S rRNA (guanosine2251-2'-O)-methyltransferase